MINNKNLIIVIKKNRTDSHLAYEGILRGIKGLIPVLLSENLLNFYIEILNNL